MKTSKIISALLIFLAVLLAVTTVLLCIFAFSQKPILLSEPREAENLAKSVMEGVHQGDFEKISAAMAGNPDLGISREPADDLGKLLWEAFLNSFSYEFTSRCYTLNSGMAMDVSVSYLDLKGLIGSLGERTAQLLKQRAEEAEDLSEIYDQENNYREELVQDMLLQSAREALKSDLPMVTEALTIRMVNENGKWQVLPDPALIHAISCGTAG